MTLTQLSHPTISGDKVRFKLLATGADAQKQATLDAVLKDPVIQLLPIHIIQHFTRVIEGTNA